MDDIELVLTLRKPIKLGDISYTELQLSEPTAGDLIKASKAGAGMEQVAHLIHLNAKVPMRVVEQMSQRDFEAAADFFGRIGSDAQQTPGASSPA